MEKLTRVVLDAMGGDNAPQAPVEGAVNAVRSRSDMKVILVGQEQVIRGELAKYEYPEEQIEIVDAPEVIEMAEPPVLAIRRKKQSSMVVGLNLVKNGEPEAREPFVSEDRPSSARSKGYRGRRSHRSFPPRRACRC
jgi:glycerol-3-phosphate acyltransferase PlsX